MPPLLISILSAYGLAVALFEFGDHPPLSWFVTATSAILRPVKLDGVFLCPTCLGFWAALATDFLARLIIDRHYWAWPLTGFIAMGLTWTVYRAFPSQ